MDEPLLKCRGTLCENAVEPGLTMCRDCLDGDLARQSQKTAHPKTKEEIRKAREERERAIKHLQEKGIVPAAPQGFRFCPQCSSREALPVQDFDGEKLTCRKCLEKLKARRDARKNGQNGSESMSSRQPVLPTEAMPPMPAVPPMPALPATQFQDQQPGNEVPNLCAEFATLELAEEYVALLGQREGVMYNTRQKSWSSTRLTCHCSGESVAPAGQEQAGSTYCTLIGGEVFRMFSPLLCTIVYPSYS